MVMAASWTLERGENRFLAVNSWLGREERFALGNGSIDEATACVASCLPLIFSLLEDAKGRPASRSWKLIFIIILFQFDRKSPSPRFLDQLSDYFIGIVLKLLGSDSLFLQASKRPPSLQGNHQHLKKKPHLNQYKS